MYFYIYDAFLRDKKYERLLARIESRLLALGLQGKSEKLTLLKSMKDLAASATKRGADTIIAVGDDQTVSKLITYLADEDITLGMIPVGKKTKLAEMLGIPGGVAACDVLSGRIVEQLDLGKANDSYFLSYLALDPSHELLIDCERGAFHVEPHSELHDVTVYNFGAEGHDPHDGELEIVIRRHRGSDSGGLFKKGKESATVLPIRHAKMKSYGRSVAAHADGQTVVKTPLTIQVVPKKLRVIVGKERAF